MGSGNMNLNLNAGLNQQNWRQFDAPGGDVFANKAKAIAQMVYGSGLIGEGKNGGKGHIGLVGNKVVKFNTKGDERSDLKKMSKDSGTYKDMKESCDNLRRELLNMAKFADLDAESWGQIRSALGFEDGDSIKKDAGLLERTTAAAVLKKIVGAYNEKAVKEKLALINNLWDGHTPTWGRSVTSFKAAVREHNKKIDSYIGMATYQLVEETKDSLADTQDAMTRLSEKFKEKFAEYGENLEKWFRKTCDFLPGLVPAGTKNKAALESVKARMNEALEPGNKSIVAILNELTTLAKGNAASYRPQTFGDGDTFESFSKLVDSGLDEVDSRFKAMLGDLGRIKFGEDQHYPDLSKDLSNALKELPEEFEEIAEDLQSVTGAFRRAVDNFKSIETSSAAGRVEYFADLKAWNAVFKDKVTKAVEDFDSKLNDLITKHLQPNEAKTSRSASLKALAEMDGVDWKALATSLTELRNATYCTVHKTEGNNYFSSLFDVLQYQTDFQKHDPKEEAMPNDIDGFKALIERFTGVKRISTESIFWGEADERAKYPAVPLKILQKNKLHLLGNVAGNSAEHKQVFETAMAFFERLHDVATALKVVNEEGGFGEIKKEQKNQ